MSVHVGQAIDQSGDQSQAESNSKQLLKVNALKEI